MKPTVMLLTGSLGPGGTELFVITLARGLSARSAFRPLVAVLGSGGTWAETLRAEGIETIELGISGPLRRPGSVRRLLRLGGLVRERAVDLLVTFLFDADVYGMLAARRGRPRAILTTRRAIKKNRPQHIRGYRLTNGLVDGIVANSEAVRAFTLDAERVAPEKVHVVPNGTVLERFASGERVTWRARLGVADDEVLVGSIGTIKAVKGQRVLADAALDLLPRHPRLRFVLAGELTRGYGDALREAVASGEAADRIALPGVVSDVPDLLAALDVFVLPSLSEGMSNALVEAMAAGRAIVATRVGGNAECLDGGRAGRLVAPDDAPALRDAIEALVVDEGERARLGAAAARRARVEYDLARMLERYEELFARVLGERAGKGRRP